MFKLVRAGAAGAMGGLLYIVLAESIIDRQSPLRTMKQMWQDGKGSPRAVVEWMGAPAAAGVAAHFFG